MHLLDNNLRVINDNHLSADWPNTAAIEHVLQTVIKCLKNCKQTPEMNLKNLFAKRRRLLLLLTTCSILTLMLCSLNFKSQTIFSLKDFKSSARLWFLTNGTRLSLPPPLATQELALWPEDSKSDRIVNQLVFRPLLSTNQTPKKIFLKTSDGDHDWPIKMGGHEFRECPVSTCEFVGREESSLADLIFFKVSLTL